MHRKNDDKVHFASLMDLCHLKNAELDPKFQKYKGRVVLRGDMWKTTLELRRIYSETADGYGEVVLMATLALGDSAVWPKAFANLTPSEASLHQTGIRVQVPCFGSCLKKNGRSQKAVGRRPSTIRTSLTSRKSHERTLDCSVFPQCKKPLLRTFLTVKAKKACNREVVAREKEKKEKVLWSVLQNRCQTKDFRNGISASLKSHRKSCCVGWDLREHLQRRARQAIRSWKCRSEKIIPDWVWYGDPEFEEAKKFWKGVILVAPRAWFSKTTINGSQSVGRPSSARENIFV